MATSFGESLVFMEDTATPLRSPGNEKLTLSAIRRRGGSHSPRPRAGIPIPRGSCTTIGGESLTFEEVHSPGKSYAESLMFEEVLENGSPVLPPRLNSDTHTDLNSPGVTRTRSGNRVYIGGEDTPKHPSKAESAARDVSSESLRFEGKGSRQFQDTQSSLSARLVEQDISMQRITSQASSLSLRPVELEETQQDQSFPRMATSASSIAMHRIDNTPQENSLHQTASSLSMKELNRQDTAPSIKQAGSAASDNEAYEEGEDYQDNAVPSEEDAQCAPLHVPLTPTATVGASAPSGSSHSHEGTAPLTARSAEGRNTAPPRPRKSRKSEPVLKPNQGWQTQLRGVSKEKRRRHSWMVVNQPQAALPPRKVEGYHGCAFGAPPSPPRKEVGIERERHAFTHLREIDELRREVECVKCHETGHYTKDCPMIRREQKFDSSGTAHRQSTQAGTFATIPPVSERLQARINRVTPDFSGIQSRFREWERRESVPSQGNPSGRTSRSNTPTQPPRASLNVNTTLPQSANVSVDTVSPSGRKQNVIKKLQSENKKLHDAIAQMKNKMTHIDDMGGSAPSSARGSHPAVHPTNPAKPVPHATSDPQIRREVVSSPRSSSRSGRVSSSEGYAPRGDVPEPHPAQRGLSVPRRSTADIPLPRRQKAPPRLRAPAPTYTDWQVCRFFLSFFLFVLNF